MLTNDIYRCLKLFLNYLSEILVRDFSTSENNSSTTIKAQIFIIINKKVSLKPDLVSLQVPSGPLRASQKWSPQSESKKLSVQTKKREIEIGSNVRDDRGSVQNLYVRQSIKETFFQARDPLPSFAFGSFPVSRRSCAKHKNYILYIFDLIDQICQRPYRCADSHFDGKKVMI